MEPKANNVIREEEYNAFFAELENNIRDEAEAREGYYKMMVKFAYLMTPNEIKDIREIIAEELKHTRILNKMIEKRNGIQAED